MSEYDKWQARQGGFHTHAWWQTLYQMGSATKKKREVAWDGTFNMPIMPIANNKHKDLKSTIGLPL